jgi:hypothetical protein
VGGPTYQCTVAIVDAAGNASPQSGPARFTIDTAAPRVQSVIESGAPHRVAVTFSDAVVAGGIAPASITLRDLTIGRDVPAANVSVIYDPALRLATYVFPGYPGGILPDGDYRLTLPTAAVTDAAGNAMSADVTFDFYVLAGDATRDRAVNFDDLLVLAKNYNKAGATFTRGDFTGDGQVNFDDLLVLAKNYNKALPAAGPATPAAAMDVQALAAAMGIAVSTTPPAKPTPPPAPKPKPKPVPRPAPVAKPAPTAPKAPAAASVLRDDDKARPVFSTTRVATPAPATAKVVAKAKAR